MEADINGVPMRNLPASCVLQVQEGMNVKTNTAKVRKAVRKNVELILANHNRECLTCFRNGTCELQKLCEQLGIKDVPYTGATKESPGRPFLFHRPRLIKVHPLGRCISTCKTYRASVFLTLPKEASTLKLHGFDYSMKDVDCIYCGKCINACPVAALREKNYVERFGAIEDPEKFVIVQTAPAVRLP